MAKKSWKERLADKRKAYKKKGGKSNVIFLKDGDNVRARLLNGGSEKDFIFDVTTFYLGGDLKNVYSPSTFGEPCAFMEKYKELKDSKSKADKALAKLLTPKTKQMALVLVYTDNKGTDIDEERTGKLLQLTGALAAEILDFFLDEEEWGDFFNEEEGYDFKFKRTGAGKYDTEYSVSPCKPSPLPKKFRGKVFNLEEEVKKIIPTYEETQELLEEWLASDPVGKSKDEEEEERPKKRDKKHKGDA